MRAALALAFLLWIGMGPVLASGIDPALAAVYADLSIAPPRRDAVIICHGFGCKYRTMVGLTAADHNMLAQLLAGGRTSAEAERRAVAVAVAWFERRVGSVAGTAHAVARAGPKMSGDPSQFDCIDASRNTTTTLLLLEELNLLHHHQVMPPQARGYFLDGRWPHATAVLRETQTGTSWAVDSWTHKNGDKPDVLLLASWLAARH